MKEKQVFIKKEAGVLMFGASAPGKVILFGEHAVVYDKLGIAAAVDIRSVAEVTENNHRRITVKDKRLDMIQQLTESEISRLKQRVDELRKEEDYESLKQMSKDDIFSPIKYIISLFVAEHGFVPFELLLRSDIPIASGLGSGSSLFASVVSALGDFYQMNLTKKEISDMTYQGDIIAHGGTPSGIDNSTVVYGGYIAFRKSEQIKILDIKQKIPIVIGDTGIGGNTGELVGNVRKLLQQNPEKKKLLDEIDNISQDSIIAIKNNSLKELGALMNKNHELLGQLGVSHSALEKLCNAALQADAFGAKMSGAGGGGIMIAVADDQKKVAEAIEKAGGKAIITNIGVEGVKKIKTDKNQVGG